MKISFDRPYHKGRPHISAHLHTYSGVSNNHTLCIYSFPRKILPCAFISPLLNTTMIALCFYLFLENNLSRELIPYCAIIRYSRVLTYVSEFFNGILTPHPHLDCRRPLCSHIESIAMHTTLDCYRNHILVILFVDICTMYLFV